MKNNSFARFARGFLICAYFEFAAVLILYAILDGKANFEAFPREALIVHQPNSLSKYR